MNCKEIEYLIYLKPDELDFNESKALAQHLAECESCRANYIKQLNANKLVSNLAKFNPQLKFPDEFDRQIISSLTSKELKISFIDRFAELFYVPALRFSLIMILFIVSGFYFYEEGKTIISISMLEKKNELYAEQKFYSGFQVDETNLIKYLPDIYSFISGRQDYTQLSDELIIINKKGLRELISYSMNLQEVKSFLPKDFVQKYPDLAKALEGGSASGLFNQSSEQRENILKELNKVFSKGEK